MSFFKNFMKTEKEKRKDYSIEKIILTTDVGNLTDLKERINKENIIDKIFIVKGVTYSPLAYAIKVSNFTSVEYFIELDPLFYQRANFNLKKECQNLRNINIIKLLMNNGVDFNKFQYPLIKNELPEKLRLQYLNIDMSEATLGFYSQVLLDRDMNYKLEFLEQLEILEIKSNYKDFFTPSEVCILGANCIKVTKKTLENSTESLDKLFRLFLRIEDHNPTKVINFIKLFVDEKGMSLESHEPQSKNDTLILQIFNSYNKNSEIMFEAIKRMKSYNGFEEKICSILNKKQISSLKGFNITNEMKFFTLEAYNEVFNCLKTLKIFNREVLDHLIYNDYSLNEKKTLINTFIEMGGDINVLYSPTPVDSDNVNLLFMLVYSKMEEDLIPHLLQKGAKIEYDGNSALLAATHNYSLSLIKLLLSMGADPNYQNSSKDIIIEGLFLWNTHIFTFSEQQEVINLFLAAGLDIDKLYSFNGKQYSGLERIARTKDTDQLLEYFLNNNTGDFSKGEIPLRVIRKNITLENKFKIIDFNPNYRFYDEQYSMELSLLDIIYMSDMSESAILIDYMLEKYPKVKLSYIKQNFYFHEEGLNISTYEKLMRNNSDLIKKKYRFDTPDDLTSYNPITLFLRSMDFLNRYNEGKIDEIISILNLYVELGDDANTRIKSSILQIISFEMTNLNKIDLRIFNWLYQNGFDIERKDGTHNETPLLELHRYNIEDYNPVAEDVYVSILDFFWEKKPFDLNIRSGVEDDLLLAYSKACLPKVVEWILRKGGNINTIGGFDNSPALHKAISNHSMISPRRRAQTVEVLLKYGADIEQVCNADHYTPLMSAVFYGAKECVKVLLQAGANVNAISPTGAIASQLAVLSPRSYDAPGPNNYESIQSNILKTLVEYGSELNFPGQMEGTIWTPLQGTILNNKKEIFETLLQLGADINFKDLKNGATPLMIAVSYGENYFITRLLAVNSNVELTNKFGQNVLFYCLHRENREEAISLYDSFKKNGLKEGKAAGNMNLLLQASSHLYNPFIEILSKDIDINSSDDHGYTPLIWAISSNVDCDIHERMACINKIVFLGGSLESVDNYGRTPLIWAADLKYPEIIDNLIRLGASVELSISIALQFNLNEEILTTLKKYKPSNNILFS